MVLFVSVENTFRSVLSEAIFNADAPKGWHAESAGVQPAETINPIAIELLSEVGIGLGEETEANLTGVGRSRLAGHHIQLRGPLPYRGEAEI